MNESLPKKIQRYFRQLMKEKRIRGEGVVFHELHGWRAAKVKKTDFGLDWP